MLQIVVLLIGTNNHAHTAEQVSSGILTIVDEIRKKQKQAQIIVMVSNNIFYQRFVLTNILIYRRRKQAKKMCINS